jgi:hypothetical protein
MEDYALAMAEWFENRVRAHEQKFPQLVVLKAEVSAATLEVKNAETDDVIKHALDRQNRAICALITFLPV